VKQSIRGYADGLVEREGGDGVRAMAPEVAAIAAIAAGSDDLRRVLSDPGVPVASRRAVTRDLFESRVGPATLRAVSFVLEADRAPDTVSDLEWLAGRLDAALHQMHPVDEAVLGRHAAAERAEGYATAVLEAADRGALAEIEDELFRFARIAAGSDELRDALTSRDLPADARRQLVSDLLSGKANPATVALAAYSTRVGRPRDYFGLLDTLVSRVAAETNRRLADVRSAVALDDRQQDELAGALSRSLGHPVEVRVTLDPALLAGFVATVGDTVVDASARHRLDVLKERLVLPEPNVTTGESH
jgi:F-type H+-transporting ATPase subunit delta